MIKWEIVENPGMYPIIRKIDGSRIVKSAHYPDEPPSDAPIGKKEIYLRACADFRQKIREKEEKEMAIAMAAKKELAAIIPEPIPPMEKKPSDMDRPIEPVRPDEPVWPSVELPWSGYGIPRQWIAKYIPGGEVETGFFRDEYVQEHYDESPDGYRPAGYIDTVKYVFHRSQYEISEEIKADLLTRGSAMEIAYWAAIAVYDEVIAKFRKESEEYSNRLNEIAQWEKALIKSLNNLTPGQRLSYFIEEIGEKMVMELLERYPVQLKKFMLADNPYFGVRDAAIYIRDDD